MFQHGNKFQFFFGMFMVAIYVGMGSYIIFFWEGINNMPEYFRVIFGLLFIAYGVFRMFRYAKLKKESDENENK